MFPMHENVHQGAKQNRREGQQTGQVGLVLDEDESPHGGDCHPQNDGHDASRKPRS
jgi:hypothetical protein